VQITEKVCGETISSTEANKKFVRKDAKKVAKLLYDFKSIDYACNNMYFYDIIRLLFKTFQINGACKTFRIILLNLRLIGKISKNTELTHGDFTERNIVFGKKLYLLDFTEIKRSIKYFDASFLFLHNLRNLQNRTWHTDFILDYLANDNDVDRGLLRVSFIHSALWHLSNHLDCSERKEQLDFFLYPNSKGSKLFFDRILNNL
jgi:hypothetical protein